MKERKLKKILLSATLGVMAMTSPFAIAGCGVEGEIDVRIEGDYVQWSAEGSDEWKDLLTITEIKDLLGEGYKGVAGEKGEQGNPGIDGKEVEFRKSETHIQWRYVTPDDSEEWKDLVALSDISGSQGESVEWIRGKGVPTKETGKSGDYYINMTTGDIYFRNADEWAVFGHMDILPSENAIKYGDIDGDGVINTRDGLYVSRYINGTKELSEEQLAAADLNLDEEVNYIDYRILLDYLSTAYKFELPSPNYVIYGDVNNDGKVNSLDGLLLGRFIRDDNLESDINIKNSDLNLDGTISYSDYVLLLRYFNGWYEQFPVVYQLGDMNMDGEITEDDYDILDGDLENLTDKQMMILPAAGIEESKILLRAYLDQEIETLDKEYVFINLDFNGDQNVDNVKTLFFVELGSKISSLPMLEKEDYIFEGWRNNQGELVTTDTFINNNMTLTPSWTAEFYGDVNGDGEIDSLDGFMLSRYVSGFDVDEDVFNNGNADINMDGRVTYTDSLYLLKHLNGWEGEFPVRYQLGDMDMDGEITENDYTVLENNYDELNEIQKLIMPGQNKVEGMKLLRSYLDKEIETLDREYVFVTLDFDGEENVNNVDTLFFIEKGTKIPSLPSLKKDGFVFDGWKNEQGQIVTTDTEINNSVILTPSWSEEDV